MSRDSLFLLVVREIQDDDTLKSGRDYEEARPSFLHCQLSYSFVPVLKCMNKCQKVAKFVPAYCSTKAERSTI